MTSTTTPDRATILNWHPPGHRSTTTTDTPFGRATTAVMFDPFSGTEPQPEPPPWLGDAYTLAYGGTGRTDPNTWDRELLDTLGQIGEEVQAAQTLWRAANYQHTVTEALRAGVPVLKEFRRARSAADAAYAAIEDAPDGQWQVALLRLTRARQAALAAAEALDDAAYPIARAWEAQPERVLELTRRVADLAKDAGLDITGWDSVEYDLSSFRDWGGYTPRFPTREKLVAEYAQQDSELAEVARLISTTDRDVT